MTDLSKTIAPRSDQLNSDDLIAGPRDITVRDVRGNEGQDQPVSVYFEGDNNKPYKPCLSMRRVLVQVWGADGAKYIGKSMRLYLDPEVKFGGIKVGGIRISHMSHIDRPQSLMLTTTRSKKGEFRVVPLAANRSEEALGLAREAADRGTEAFTEFWNSDFGKEHRALLKQHIDELKKRATDADEAAKPLSQRLQTDAESGQEGDPAPEGTDTPDQPEIDPTELEYAEGQQAARDGKSVADCPYANDAGKMSHWMAGYKAEDGK